MTTFRTDTEGDFVRDCLKAYLFQEDAIMPPDPGLNWDKFYQVLVRNRLIGLFSILGRAYPDVWPKAVKDRLREARFRQIPYHDWCTRQAGVVLTALSERNIPVIVLKGWALVPLVYGGDTSQRPSADIDLLVRPCDAAQAANALYKAGYGDLDLEPWPGYFRRYMNSSHYLSTQTYPGSDQAFNVDMHWGFPDAPYYDRRIEVEVLFERGQAIRVAGVEVRSLATEDLLVYTSVHMAHHGYTDTLSRYYDMAALMLRAGTGLDWGRVMANAVRWGVTIPVQRMLAEIERIWPGVVPAGALKEAERLRASWSEQFTDWGLRKIRNKEAAGILLAVLNTPGLGRRLGFFLETAFPGERYLRHYFGPAPGVPWLILNLRRFARFLGG